MGKADGYLKIKTRLDNSDVDKDVKDLENKIKKVHTDNANASNEQRTLQAEIDKYNQLTQKADKYKQQLKTLQKEKKDMFAMNPSLAVSTTPEYSNLTSQIDVMRQKYAEATKEIDKQSPKIDKVYQKLNKVKAKQEENNAKISEFKAKIDQIEIRKMEQGINAVGKSITGTIGNIGKMAFAIVGIKTAFSAVRSIVNTISQYNPQIATDINYIKYALAQTVLPIVQKLVSLAYTLLGYINAITSAWFGFNLFANSSAKKFKGIASSAKSINNSLAGFDEINVLSDNKSDSSGGGGAETPSMDLSSMQGEVPSWLQWIIDNKDLILSIMAGIASGLLLIKLGVSGIKALGIGIVITGIVSLIQSLISYLNDPSWENFGKIISSIGIILLGLGIIIGNIPLIIAGVIAIIVGLVVSNWENIKGVLQGAVDWMYSKMEWIRDNFGIVGQAIWHSMIDLVEVAIDTFEGLFSGIKTILDGIIKVFKGIFNGDMKMVLEGFKQIFKGIFDSLWSIAKAPLNLIIKGINHLIDGANKIKFDVPDWVPGLGGKTFGFNIMKLPELAKGGIVDGPTPLIAGEAGKETILPLENNTEWMDILAEKIARILNISSEGNEGRDIVIKFDGTLAQLIRLLKPELDNESKRKGDKLIIGGTT